MNRRFLTGRILPLVFLLCCIGSSYGEGSEPAGGYPLIFFGRILLADAPRLELRRAGTLSPAAPMVAADAAGRIWGRLEPRYFAALDPVRDRIVTRVKLPHKSHIFLITRAGKAYVTHRSPTREGYSISVVDTRQGMLLRELKGIAGLPVDLAEAAGFVYLAAAGVLRDDPMESHLYQIEEETDRIHEVLDSSDTGYSWKITAAGDRLYLGYLPSRENPWNGRVEVRDARTFRLLRSWEASPGPLRGLYASERQVLLFSEGKGGGTELLLLDPLLNAASQARLLEGPVARVLGVHGSRLVYLDYPFEAGYTNVSVRFYDLEAGRELKRINIRDYLIAKGTQ